MLAQALGCRCVDLKHPGSFLVVGKQSVAIDGVAILLHSLQQFFRSLQLKRNPTTHVDEDGAGM